MNDVIETNVIETIQTIQDAPANTEMRITRRLEIGSVVQQGDLYVHHVATDHCRGEQIGKDSVQVAMGTGNGARHVAEGPVMVYLGKCLPPKVSAPMEVRESEILGPVVVAHGPWMLTHPEHPHHRLPKGVYQVTYQYDPHTMQRVID